MNLQLTGHQLDITPAIRAYVTSKLERITRHFDHVIDVNVILSVNKLAAESRSQRARARAATSSAKAAIPTCTPPSTAWWTSSTARSSSTRKKSPRIVKTAQAATAPPNELHCSAGHELSVSAA